MVRFALASLVVLVAFPAAHAASSKLPGCEASAPVRKDLKQLSGPAFDRLTYAEQLERKQHVLTALMARYPREAAPYTQWIEAVREDALVHPELLAGLQKDLRSKAEAHPDDPLALYIAAVALYETDTPASLRMLERAQTLAPAWPLPALQLARIYNDGKFADKAKFEQQLGKYWTGCPTSDDYWAGWMLVKSPALQAKVVAAQRPILERSQNPEQLMRYADLWGLEFRTTSPKDYPALRQRVAADVARLKRIHNPHPDVKWANLLLAAEKQSGADEATIHASENALVADYPHSGEALGILRTRWHKEHPDPTDEKDTAAWTAHNAAFWAQEQQWIAQFPDEYWPPAYYKMAVLPLTVTMSPAEGQKLVAEAVESAGRDYPPSFGEWVDISAGQSLLTRQWDPAQALGYMQSAMVWQDRQDAQYRSEDDHTADEVGEHEKNAKEMRGYVRGMLLLAAMRAGRADAVTPEIRAAIEAPRQADDKDESGYWLNRARLAVLDGKKQDALTYYQSALRMRAKGPQYDSGYLPPDDLLTESHALFTSLGGSDVAWNAWSAPPANSAAAAAKAADARWEKPTKTLPDFQLADLSGRTWTTKSLNGKVVLINLWATWCGPCNAELPQLQKLYEASKDRKDLQILTFNLDDDPGVIEPFMKEKGYTFPVVPAYSYVVSLLNGYAIPQSWVLNPKGTWEWTQIGYGADDAWVKDMEAKLAAVSAGG